MGGFTEEGEVGAGGPEGEEDDLLLSPSPLSADEDQIASFACHRKALLSYVCLHESVHYCICSRVSQDREILANFLHFAP